MRVGFNPHKDKFKEEYEYSHQVIIPVYIPNQEGYFKDSFKILQICLESLFTTVHDKTFISIVNNGSCDPVKDYLEELFQEKLIQEVIHTQNIGKLNAVLKGLTGNGIDLVTISDSDVLFLSNWQEQTVSVFDRIPQAGVVGIVPQFKMYESHCGNVIFDNFFNNKLKFIPVKNPEAMIRFYDSIGWDKNYNPDYLKFSLGYQIEDFKVYVGSGHFVATYKKDLFEDVITNIPFKMGGGSEGYLDRSPLKKGYWRLTTYDNYAYHMGNTYEEWMKIENKRIFVPSCTRLISTKRKKINKINHLLKNRFFIKFISINSLNKRFLKHKKLPTAMINTY